MCVDCLMTMLARIDCQRNSYNLWVAVKSFAKAASNISPMLPIILKLSCSGTELNIASACHKKLNCKIWVESRV